MAASASPVPIPERVHRDAFDQHGQQRQLHQSNAQLRHQSLNYNIYVNAADTEIFGGGTGNGVNGTYYYYLCYAGGTVFCAGGSGQSGTQYIAPMYGLLPAQQDVGAGLYTDTIIATITY